MWHAEGLKKTGIDEEGNLQWPLPFDDMEKGIMEPYERALQYKGENVVQVGLPRRGMTILYLLFLRCGAVILFLLGLRGTTSL